MTKNYFLGFFPDQQSNFAIRKVVAAVGKVFDGQEIKVRWSIPEHFHVSVMFLGNNLNPLQKVLFNLKFRKLILPKFEIGFDRCELGISRGYKELIYLTVKVGGEQLRDLVYTLREKLKIEDQGNYIPHLTLGRVSKDLSSEEFKNLSTDLRNVNGTLNISDIRFTPNNLLFVESNLNTYKVLKKFDM